MADWLFIVSHTKPGTSAHMKLVTESKYVVILDRRKADRRRIHQRATPERRNGERADDHTDRGRAEPRVAREVDRHHHRERTCSGGEEEDGEVGR